MPEPINRNDASPATAPAWLRDRLDHYEQRGRDLGADPDAMRVFRDLAGAELLAAAARQPPAHATTAAPPPEPSK